MDKLRVNFEVVHASLRWTSPAADPTWERLASVCGDQSTKHDDLVVLEAILPDSPEKLVLSLVVAKNDGELRWAVLLSSPPDTEPPQTVVDRNRRVGGAEGLVDLVESSFGSQGSPRGTYRAHLHFPLASARCRLLPRELHHADSPMLELAGVVEPVEIGFRLRDGIMGLTSMSLDVSHGDDYIGLDFVSAHIVQVRVGVWLPHIVSVAEQLATKLFEGIAT